MWPENANSLAKTSSKIDSQMGQTSTRRFISTHSLVEEYTKILIDFYTKFGILHCFHTIFEGFFLLAGGTRTDFFFSKNSPKFEKPSNFGGFFFWKF